MSPPRVAADLHVCSVQACSPSISKRLASTLALVVLVALGAASVVVYMATSMRLREAQQDTLSDKTHVLREFIAVACTRGEDELLRKLTLFEPARSGTSLVLTRGDGTALFNEREQRRFVFSRGADFVVKAPNIAGGEVRGHLEIDTTHDTRMLKGLVVTLLLTTLVGAGITAWFIRWRVLHDLRPLADLAAQTRAISPQRLHQRLQMDRPAEELAPWIEQFNALMGRLERAYAQLEGFNADVAHELRTPLANLIGQTEVALSRERSTEVLRDTLVSNLEEMHRLSAMVNDMLFLSHADRGAVARRGEPVSLAALAQQVVEFHEAPLEEAGLRLRVDGDAHLPVDESLVKRALSNLLGNATRFARHGSTVVVQIAPSPEAQAVQLCVLNEGEPIAEHALPRMFDRFFRGEASRCCPEEQHHGLGLAIVAAIARMHQGRTLVDCTDGTTRVGFTLAQA
ncbi:MAG: heavy metal sensor histidine kinase [Rubrivivax sp.]|jgi:two-component system heavy metal sensor histidine kinase CusS